MITERAFRKKIDERLKEIPNSWWESIQQQAIHGTPDKIGVINGRFIGLELKRSARAEFSKLQKYKLDKINEAGGYGRLLHPDNVEEIFKDLYTMSVKNVQVSN